MKHVTSEWPPHCKFRSECCRSVPVFGVACRRNVWSDL